MPNDTTPLMQFSNEILKMIGENLPLPDYDRFSYTCRRLYSIFGGSEDQKKMRLPYLNEHLQIEHLATDAPNRLVCLRYLDSKNVYSYRVDSNTLTQVGCVTLPKEAEGESIQQRVNSCGTILIRTDKENFYESGPEPLKGTSTFKKLDLPLDNGEVIQKTASSDRTTYLLTNKGRLYSCGNNYWGQLGLDHTNNRSTFVKVPLTLDDGAVIREIVPDC